MLILPPARNSIQVDSVLTCGTVFDRGQGTVLAVRIGAISILVCLKIAPRGVEWRLSVDARNCSILDRSESMTGEIAATQVARPATAIPINADREQSPPF